ncbi:MAG: hypothetical protein EON60_09640 [Alphaproteobacteria bacterium]|nr:MAG: hypothetical protein EON60_09640 [Alphaproteobacteria bacterium]
MLERAPVVGDFIMWPNNEELNLLFVKVVRDDDFGATVVKTMTDDVLPRSISYAMTGEYEAMAKGPAERALECAKNIRFATSDEIEKGFREGADHLSEEHLIAMRSEDEIAVRLAKLAALRKYAAAITEA